MGRDPRTLPTATAPRALRTAAEIARTTIGPRPLPDLGRTKPRRAPSSQQTVTDGGLAIVAVRRASSPMIEVRLRIPFGGTSPEHAARAEVLAETILLGTRRRGREALDAELALVGGHLTAQVTPQRLLLSGAVLAPGMPVLLDVLADAMTGAAYRSRDVAREKDRLVEHLTIASAQPATIARERLLRKRFGDHPAAWEMPRIDLVASCSPAAIRGLHRRSVLPRGSTLVLVGDLKPRAAVDAAAEAFRGWADTGTARPLAAPPDTSGGPLTAYHRGGAVQSQTRLTLPGVLRTDPAYPAAQLANVVFGGYFSSRLVENLREDKGFTYHANSSIEFWPDRAAVTVGYDTATDVVAAALVEARYELGRIAVTAPTDAEVDAARNYTIGSLASSLASQSGYASMLSSLAGSGLDGRWLARHQAGLAATTTADVAAAAERLFAPAGMTGVIIGDLEASGSALTRLDGVRLDGADLRR